MTTKNVKMQALNNIDFAALSKNLYLVFAQPIIEVWYGLKTKILPLYVCFSISALFQLFSLLDLDAWLVYQLGIYQHIHSDFLSSVYNISISLSGFYFWGLFQVSLRLKLKRRLKETFINCGLKSITGRFPSFIFDRPVDKETRKLRVTRNGFSLKQFQSAKDQLASSLQVFIDDISEIRACGTVDIRYAFTELERNFKIENVNDIAKDTIVIGKARSQVLKVKLAEVPHLLIAGQTGGGKSTFLRSIITSTYLNNKNYKFDLIDLKGGLEFQTFQGLERVHVYSGVESAISVLERFSDTTIQERMEMLKANNCKDIDSFLKLNKKDITIPEGSSFNGSMNRQIIAVDECFDVFMAGPQASSKQVMSARRSASKIAAQGRAVGVHLWVATQRPDRRAIDPQTKANLTGKLCFRLPNNASSMTVLDSGKATELPEIKGRGYWQCSNELIEIQAPNFSEDEAELLLASLKIKKVKISQTQMQSTTKNPSF